jgi:hypothetical protein
VSITSFIVFIILVDSSEVFIKTFFAGNTWSKVLSILLLSFPGSELDNFYNIVLPSSSPKLEIPLKETLSFSILKFSNFNGTT